MTRYAPEEREGQGQGQDGKQREIDHLRRLNHSLCEEGIAAAARLVCMRSDLDAAVNLVLAQGLATGHADTFEDLMHEVLAEFAEVKADRDRWRARARDLAKRVDPAISVPPNLGYFEGKA